MKLITGLMPRFANLRRGLAAAVVIGAVALVAALAMLSAGAQARMDDTDVSYIIINNSASDIDTTSYLVDPFQYASGLGSVISITGVISPYAIDGSPPAEYSSYNTITVDVHTSYPTGYSYTIIAGGSNAQDDATYNTLNINNTIAGSAVGGYSDAVYADEKEVSNNTINFNAGTVGGLLIGGNITSGTVSNNTVNVRPASGTVSARAIYAGHNEHGGSMVGNKVDVSGAGTLTVTFGIMGASTDGDLADSASSLKDNQVKVEMTGTGDVTARFVAGAWLNGQPTGAPVGYSHELSGNTVTLNAGKYSEYVAGAYISNYGSSASANHVKNALLSGNKVTITGEVAVGDNIFGAIVNPNVLNSNVFRDNEVFLDGKLTNYFGHDIYNIFGAYGTSSDEATGNKVTLNATDNFGVGAIAGSWMEGGAKTSDNHVLLTVEDGKTLTVGNVVGSYTNGSSADKADSNTVKMYGAFNVTNGILGGRVGTGTADGNTVEIDGLDGVAALGGEIFGGRVETNTAATSSASGNTVRLANVALSLPVYGGFIDGSFDGTATGNKVELSGKVNIATSSVFLVGGDSQTAGSADKFHGNTLTFNFVDYGTSAYTFSMLRGFENINANVTSDVAKDAINGAPGSLIPASGTIELGNSTDPTHVNVHVVGPEIFSVGDTVNVFAPGTTFSWTNGELSFTRNFMEYTGTETNNVFTIEGRAPMEEAKVLSELPLADISFVNRGADFIASQAIPAALSAVSGTVGVSAFASVGYGWSRTETGSHIDVKGVSGDVGIAFATETSVGPFAAGAFVEFGDGTFDSYNEFAGIPTVHGEGDVDYLGGGVFARLDVGQADASRPYFEASVRFGKTDAEFRTRDILFFGEELKYDMDSKYWGFHAGLGYILDFSSFDGSLDLSAKYFHTHRDGDDFLFDGDRVSLSSVTSSRIKLGGRLNAGITQTIKGYFGLYYEHEFDGDSRVTYAGVGLPEATLSGSTGVGELGLIVAAPGSPVEVQMGVQGSAGRRDSLAANLSLKFTF